MVNLISMMPPIRSQGPRGTCVAFTLTALHEYVLRRRGDNQDLSEQHLYYEIKQIDGAPNQCGTWQAKAVSVLGSRGQCREVIWPYHPDSDCNDHGPLPSRARSDGLRYRLSAIQGPVSVEGGGTGADRSLCSAVKLPGEKDGPSFSIAAQASESRQIDVLNIFNDSSQQNSSGVLTSRIPLAKSGAVRPFTPTNSPPRSAEAVQPGRTRLDFRRLGFRRLGFRRLGRLSAGNLRLFIAEVAALPVTGLAVPW